tara:strand:+ start:4188 stop:5234 length:1047 start_codon:yes stop_codon:yes gene_type:complete
MKTTKKKLRTISDLINKLKKNYFNFNLVITYLAVLNLNVEKIIFDKKDKKNPIVRVNKLLDILIAQLKLIKPVEKFGKNEKLKIKNFKLEKDHQEIFNNLWVNYSFKEYTRKRIGRYLMRIKINNLKDKIKNKNVIDFGCGHGNFLLACKKTGAKSCLGIDYGKDSINYVKSYMNLKQNRHLKKSCKFYFRSIYNPKVKAGYFDFAIQNGVFHHMKDEKRAYQQVYKALKPGGYFWVYTDGGGGLRDMVFDATQKILKNFDKKFIINKLRQMGLTTDKQYHLGDGFTAKYRHSTYEKMCRFLKSIGFENFKQLNGGCETDFDKPFYKIKYFKERFGSGDLRILCQKKI